MMRFHHVAAAALFTALALLAGCRSLPGPTAELRRYLLDDFEQDELWTLDSADNHGLVKYSRENATRGQNLMQLSFFDNGRGKTVFRREVAYDLATASRLWLDILNPNSGGGIQCALAFHAGDGGYFETAPVTIGPGWNKDVEFAVTGAGLKAGTDATTWLAKRHKVTRIMILVFPGLNKKGTVNVDNLRADVPGVNREVQPRLVRVDETPRQVRRMEPVELSMAVARESVIDQSAAQPGKLMPVKMQARLTAPDGTKKVVDGFLKAVDEDTDGKATYAVRFTVDQPGQWGMDLGYTAGREWRRISGRGFFCGKSVAGSGKPAIDRQDPRFFSLSSGSFFYPLGQNVCWAADYEPYMKAAFQYDGNFMRIWVCPWNNPVLAQDDYLSINLDAAAAIDRIFELAQKYHLYIQLVLTQHGSLIGDWHRNPFNAANGGPCTLPQDFWVSPEARAAFKDYINYVVQRWSYHPNLFAFELVNEADYAERYRDEDVLNWHREMSDHLKSVDPHRSLVTASIVDHKEFGNILRLPSVDFTTSHLYGKDPAAELVGALALHGTYNKPYFVGEIGRSWQATGDQVDRQGVHLHHSLWLAWMTPAAGNALPWWWDTHIEPNKLQYHFTALAAFSKGEDRRGRNLREWSAAVKSGSHARVRGLADRVSAYGFVYDPTRIEQPDTSSARPVLSEGCYLKLTGMLDGDYKFEVWDTRKGRVVTQRKVTCKAGELSLPLPESESDFAFKARLEGETGITAEISIPARTPEPHPPAQ